MTFGEAIEKMRNGELVAREGWNGKGMFLWMKPGAVVPSKFIQDKVLKSIAESQGGEVCCLPIVCMKTADNKVVSGWLASQADIFATDWIVVYNG